MKIMTVDTQSNSLNFKIFDFDNLDHLIKGKVCRIGLEKSYYEIKAQDFEISEGRQISDYDAALDLICDKLIETGLIYNTEDIRVIAFRVVHGGELYQEATLISDKVISDILSLTDLAPHSNPVIAGLIKHAKTVFKGSALVAVFETAFYQTMAKEAYLYPLPYSWYEKYGIRKYGFYGISEESVYQRLLKEVSGEFLSVISCRLGDGGSITAIKDGEVLDTSMGFSPISGIMMGSRSGDIDPSIITYVMEKEGKSAGEVIRDLKDKAGFLGLSQYSSDVKSISLAAEEGDEKASIAMKIFIDYVVAYISEYYVKLGKVDAIVFSAGIGENASLIRKKIIDKLEVLGIYLDEEANEIKKDFALISKKNSKVAVYVVPSDEHQFMALKAKKIYDR